MSVSQYADYFLNTAATIARLQLLEISHSSFSTVFRVVRNMSDGVTVTHESPPGGSFFYQYLPLEVSTLGISNDLDQAIRVSFGDLGQILPIELDQVVFENTTEEKPVVVYREYRSDDLTAPLFGPASLEIDTITSDENGSSFEAKAIEVNLNRTGELYEISRFPMLRGLL